jgi:hypothetical protein
MQTVEPQQPTSGCVPVVQQQCLDQILTRLHRLDAQLHQINGKVPQQPINEADVVTVSPLQNLEPQQLPKSTLIVKTLDRSNPKDILDVAKNLQKVVCPTNIQIKKIKISNNILEVRADSESSKETLKGLLSESELAPNVIIEDKRPMRTKVIIFNLTPGTDEAVLKNALRARLSTSEDFVLEITRKLASRRAGLEHWVVSLPRRAAQVLLHSHFTYIGFQKIYYKKYIHITRCTNCQRLNDHTASTCTASHHFCSTCGENHHFFQCQNESPFCVNCHEFNWHLQCTAVSNDDQVLKQLVDVNHSAASSQCPCYKFLFARHQGTL